MTNFHIKTALLAAATLALALTGCKKDEEYAFLSLDTASMDFEWGQTKEVGFTARQIASYGTPTVPTGWTCTRSGNKFVITAPMQSADGTNMKGKIKVTAKSKDDTELSREISVAIKIAREIAAGANSIIVSRPGDRFKFYARRRGNESSGTSLAAATGGALVWATSKTVVFNVSLEGDHLFFSTANTTELEEGNAVVAVTDSNGVVMWSWHIWVTTFDPAAEPDHLGGSVVMSRNLGALANSNATPAEAALSYGLYYQWGRKDPFVGPAVWNSNVPRALYNVSGNYTTHHYNVSSDEVDTDGDGKTDNVAGSLEFATAYPNNFIAGLESNDFDWLDGGHNTGAWSPASKTLHDPCPAGWRVAPPTIWDGFTATGASSTDPAGFGVEGDYAYGWTFKPDAQLPDQSVRVFFPAAGRRSFSPTLAKPEDNYTNVVNDADGVGHPKGFYWSALHPLHSPTGIDEPGGGASLVFRNDYVNPAATRGATEEYAPAGGFPLRCVAE
jgi:hypothetical protein